MNLIVSVDENWAIGNKGELLMHIPEDMKYFRSMTIGKTVVAGQKTLAGFPGKRPLSGRENIILSDDPAFVCEGAVVVRSVPETLEYLRGKNSAEVFIIGGGSVYREFLPYCDTAYVTRLKKSFEADTFIENLSLSADWELASAGEPREYEGLAFSFDIYKRRNSAAAE